MKINKSFLGIFLGLFLIFVFSFGAYAKNDFKDFNISYGYKDISLKKVENNGIICRLNLYILLKYILKENNIINQNNENKIKEEFLYNVFSLDFKNSNKMEGGVYSYSLDMEFINKIKEVFSKTDFKGIKISEAMFKEAKGEFIEYIEDNVLKEFNSLKEQYDALEKGEKAIEELFEKYIIEGRNKVEQRLKSGELTQRDRAQSEEAILIAEEDLKFFDKLKNNLQLDEYEKEKKRELKEQIELNIKVLYEDLLCVLKILKESENLKYEDVKDLHKNLIFDGTIKQ